ncbi:unnamed protein product [Microthlaspi erraticum]|uniref:Bifunctional inhibitor/plant lipid transfer protein/seed storage helical domain-containing protein n=1 Tax=Microthlaspi erraticum TaxID=1685480 RepID=A0A6D2KXB3_9BRAS|nr:unnamed protein product [Microthlaspi erraticum]
MKLTTLVFLVLGTIIQLSPSLIRACEMKDLEPCLLPIIGGIPPTPHCCGKLIDNKACMCGFINDYWLGTVWKSPNGHKLFDACKIPYPTC